MSLTSFTNAYVEAALWSSTDDDGEPFDSKPELELSDDTVARMKKDTASFYGKYAQLLPDDARGGHDFWLTRNGHGAGFWDGDYEEPDATTLTKASKAYGEFDLYVGDDGEIHGSGGREQNPLAKYWITYEHPSIGTPDNRGFTSFFSTPGGNMEDIETVVATIKKLGHNAYVDNSKGTPMLIIQATPDSRAFDEAWDLLHRAPESIRRVVRNPVDPSGLASLDDWNTYGSGTAAPRGHEHRYDAFLDGGTLAQGRMQYTIDPVANQSGRFMGYKLQVAGHPANSGLWFTIGTYRTARQAAKAAAQHYRQNEHAVQNPGDEESIAQVYVTEDQHDAENLYRHFEQQIHIPAAVVERVNKHGKPFWIVEVLPEHAQTARRARDAYYEDMYRVRNGRSYVRRGVRPPPGWTPYPGAVGSKGVGYQHGVVAGLPGRMGNPGGTGDWRQERRALADGLRRYKQAVSFLGSSNRKKLPDGTMVYITGPGDRTIAIVHPSGNRNTGGVDITPDGSFSAMGGDTMWLKKYSPTGKEEAV